MVDLPETRHSLLIRLRSMDDTTAWEEFVVIYEAAIYRFARCKGLQRADAEDVTQEVLQAVYGRLPDWELREGGGSFRAWLFRATRNLAARTWNDRHRYVPWRHDTTGDGEVDHLPDPSAEDQTLFELEYRRAVFHRAAEQVRHEVRSSTWTAFWMTAVEGVTAEETARHLKISVGSVYTAKCRVLARMRAMIRGLEADGSCRPT